MNFTGGLFYHFRALRFRMDLWQDHESSVARFLEEWNPSSKVLTLVGPSAGYSIPDSFLKRFDGVVAYEPDLLARTIFSKMHSSPVEWRGRWDFQVFDGAVLFCNLLGQIVIRNEREFRRQMTRYLAGREYASYHDVLSGFDLEFDCEDAPRTKAKLSLMKSWIYAKRKMRTHVEVNAHQTLDLFESEPSRRFRYWQWRITPNQTQLIEGVSSKP